MEQLQRLPLIWILLLSDTTPDTLFRAEHIRVVYVTSKTKKAQQTSAYVLVNRGYEVKQFVFHMEGTFGPEDFVDVAGL